MRVSLAIAFTVGAVVSSLVTLDAQACGESLFRVGKGVAYRAQTAPLPGNVLLVSPDTGLADRLAAAGHHIKVVATADQIAQELRSGKFDVVLASFNDREIVAQQTAGLSNAPRFVPVTTEAGQKAVAARSYERYLSDDDDLTQFLRVIHRTLKASRAS
jgi:hypothetical protein